MTQETSTAEQLDLDGQPNRVPAAPTLPGDPAPPPVQLGLDIDTAVAIRLPRGLGVAWQDTLPSGKE